MDTAIRFIVDTQHPPAFNMAADLFIMDRCASGSTVTVRFYSWHPASITLGQAQDAFRQLDFEAMANDGIAWIRRPTGGRAVLHREDLTYSCIFPRSVSSMGSDVESTYSVITRCLVAGLLRAGVSADVHDSAGQLIRPGNEVKLPCFIAPSRNEVMVNGRKLIGSAQYRNANSVVQHGSLPLTVSYRLLPRYLRVSEEERIRQTILLAEKSISLREVDETLTEERLVPALKHGFSSILGFQCREEGWSWEEMKEIERICESESFRNRWSPAAAAPY